MKTFNGIDYEQAKASLVNFLGALAAMTETREDKQVFAAMLLEQLFSFTQNENDRTHNLYALKPLYRSIVNLNMERISLLKSAGVMTAEIEKQLSLYQEMNEKINELINRIN